MKRSEWILAVLSCSVFASFTAHAQPGPLWQSTSYKGQEIGKLTGDVYYARMDDYVSVFMVTPDGIVLVEPIGTEMATWLKGELNRRVSSPLSQVANSVPIGSTRTMPSGVTMNTDT